jgi:FkbM family methyltransferase
MSESNHSSKVAIHWDDFNDRIELACSGIANVAHLAKVPDAGNVYTSDGVSFQIMFNGLKVLTDCYYGSWMTKLIQRLGGHHEPQEEKVFHECLRSLSGANSMIELGAYWGYYSLWFKSIFPESTVIVTEPDPANLNFAVKHARLNQLHLFAELGGVFPTATTEIPSGLLPENPFCSVPSITVGGLMKKYSLTRLDILHADIQGAEFQMLEEARPLFEERLIDHLFLSTHWKTIHEKCRHLLQDLVSRQINFFHFL